MRALKVIFTILAVIIGAYLVVIFYGVEESVYQCAGSPIASTRGAPSTLFMKLDRYRWFILWGESDGMMKYEIPPNRGGSLFTKVKRVAEYLQFFDFDGSLQGQFSTISNSLTLQLYDKTQFAGACTQTK